MVYIIPKAFYFFIKGRNSSSCCWLIYKAHEFVVGDLMSASKRVIDVARKNVVSGHPDDSLSSVAKKMVDHWISSVVIIDKGKPVGIVTDGIIFRLIAQGHNPLKLTAKKVMVQPVPTIHENTRLEDAEATIQQSKVKRLVLVDDHGQIKGIVSQKDHRSICRVFLRGSAYSSSTRSTRLILNLLSLLATNHFFGSET